MGILNNKPAPLGPEQPAPKPGARHHGKKRLNPLRERGITKFGNPVQEHCCLEAKCGPLKPWEKWERRAVVMDEAYQAWGRHE